MSSSDSAPTEQAEPPQLVASVVPLVPVWRVDRTFDYSVPPKLASVVEIGSLVRARFGARRVRGVVVGLAERTDAGLEPIGGVVTAAPVAPPPIDKLFVWLSRRYIVPLGKAFARSVPPRVRVKATELPSFGDTTSGDMAGYDRAPELVDAISTGAGGVWCFECVPGDDRAGLIGDLVAAALKTERGGALVCVPEVHYGSRILDGLGQRFEHVARVDSAQEDGHRSAAWLQIARGHRLGAGGRAAVLAPMRDLRLLVLDEEHHRTYKEDRAPRYDARRVAIERARLQGAVCVLMSTTPSVESAAAALQGEYGWVVPTREARRAARPIVEVVPKETDRAISTNLHRRIKDALADGRRVALLAPARGYARSVWCAQCRRSLRCLRCEAGMHFDRGSSAGDTVSQLRCPRCDLRTRPPDVCPHCSSTDFRWLGAGSERLAEQLSKSFPRARVAHVDRSTMSTAATRGAEADVYVTTWIGTKAAVRPDVSLVGVIDADALIRRPHFRAAEQAFFVLGEMSEWAGAASEGGRLVVQCDEPNHYVLQALARADYRFFLERELQQREELRYPPYCELVRARVSGKDDSDVAKRVADACRGAGATVLGPIPIATTGENGAEMLVKTDDAQAVAEVLRGILPEIPSTTRVTIDVDPR